MLDKIYFVEAANGLSLSHDDTMKTATRSSSIERWFGAVALAVGRTVTSAAGVLPPVVRRASGLDDPSPEAVAAGVIRGITTLAPKTMGPITGSCIDLFGALAVLALAALSVYLDLDVEDADLCGGVLVGMISLAAQRAQLRSTTLPSGGVADREPSASQVGALEWWSAGTIQRDVIGGVLRAATRPIGPLYVVTALGEAWTAMGEAARLVEATRALARERVYAVQFAVEERSGAENAGVVILPQRLAA